MKFGVPWSVKGIRPEARETAKEAARRSGMSLGEWLLKALRWSEVAATATALVMLWPAGEALAICTPNAANNVTATCSGTTTNQDAPNGYGTGVETGITVTVISGATVTATNDGLTFNTGTVLNSGTIRGGSNGNSIGIRAVGNVNVTNSGE